MARIKSFLNRFVKLKFEFELQIWTQRLICSRMKYWCPIVDQNGWLKSNPSLKCIWRRFEGVLKSKTKPSWACFGSIRMIRHSIWSSLKVAHAQILCLNWFRVITAILRPLSVSKMFLILALIEYGNRT